MTIQEWLRWVKEEEAELAVIDRGVGGVCDICDERWLSNHSLDKVYRQNMKAVICPIHAREYALIW